MNRKLILLNFALIALAALLVWQLRQRWVKAQSDEAAILSKSGKAAAVPPPPAPAAVEKPVPANYIDVAQRTLFSKDRDPNVIIEPPPAPPPPPPEKPVPPLPSYHGQMSLGEPTILLSLEGTGQKSYRVGDQIADFRLLAFDRETITFEWDGKTIERALTELSKVEQVAVAKAPAAAPKAAPPPAKPKVTASGKRDPRGSGPAGGKYMCRGDDSSPNGTIFEGFQKTVSVGLMGSSCTWEPIE